MEIKIAPFVLLIIILLLTLIPVVVFSFLTREDSTGEYELLLAKYSELNENLGNIENKNSSIEEVLKGMSKDNENLLDQIAKLKSQKEQIKFITVTEYQTREIVKEYEEVPLEYVYRTDYDLPICHFSSKNDKVVFKTLGVEYKTIVVNGRNSSNVSTVATSLYDNLDYPIPIPDNNVEVISINDHKFIEPHISIGGMVSGSKEEFRLTPVVMVPFIHVRSHIDIVTPKVGLYSNILVGINAIDYNIGKDFRFLTDTWVGSGASTDFDSLYADLTITSKF